MMPDYSFEAATSGRVAGVDEAGRGPLAGPVVAAAVVLDPHCIPPGIDDSKQLGPVRRAALFAALADCAEIGVGWATVAEIDRLNILWATMLAMERAVAALAKAPARVLVDGNRAPRWGLATQTVIGGDARCLSIAAASIVAKVSRDRLMTALCARHPGYGWSANMGYGTPQHLAALGQLGPTVHHRRGFAPVAACLLDPPRPRGGGPPFGGGGAVTPEPAPPPRQEARLPSPKAGRIGQG